MHVSDPASPFEAVGLSRSKDVHPILAILATTRNGLLLCHFALDALRLLKLRRAPYLKTRLDVVLNGQPARPGARPLSRLRLSAPLLGASAA